MQVSRVVFPGPAIRLLQGSPAVDLCDRYTLSSHASHHCFKSFVSGYLIRHVPAEALAGCVTVMP